MHSPEPDITLSELDGVRYLHFGTEWIQGAMRIDDPVNLEIEYVRQMMAWLLFLRADQSILQLGLGAGALTRFCHAKLSGSRITVVESSRRVIEACRRWFRLPASDSRLEVLCQDASRYIAQAQDRSHGVIQCDLYDAQARGPVLDSLAFYLECRRVLADPGILVVNLFGSSRPAFERSASRIDRAFEGRVLQMPQTVAGNIVLLAFRGPSFAVGWPVLEGRARLVGSTLGLDAADWVAGLKRRAPTGTRALQVAAGSR